MPKDLQALPISFTKPIFSVCQLLSTFLTISADSRLVLINGASRCLLSDRYLAAELVQLLNYRFEWRIKILYGRVFPQKLRIVADSKIVSGLLSR